MNPSSFQILECATAYRRNPLLPEDLFYGNEPKAMLKEKPLKLPCGKGISTVMVSRKSLPFQLEDKTEQFLPSSTPRKSRLSTLNLSDVLLPSPKMQPKRQSKQKSVKKSCDMPTKIFAKFLSPNTKKRVDNSGSVKRLSNTNKFMTKCNDKDFAECSSDKNYFDFSPLGPNLLSENQNVYLGDIARQEDFLEDMINETSSSNSPDDHLYYKSDSDDSMCTTQTYL